MLAASSDHPPPVQQAEPFLQKQPVTLFVLEKREQCLLHHNLLQFLFPFFHSLPENYRPQSPQFSLPFRMVMNPTRAGEELPDVHQCEQEESWLSQQLLVIHVFHSHFT